MDILDGKNLIINTPTLSNKRKIELNDEEILKLDEFFEKVENSELLGGKLCFYAQDISQEYQKLSAFLVVAIEEFWKDGDVADARIIDELYILKPL